VNSKGRYNKLSFDRDLGWASGVEFGSRSEAKSAWLENGMWHLVVCDLEHDQDTEGDWRAPVDPNLKVRDCLLEL
jgi:hypothetical protein